MNPTKLRVWLGFVLEFVMTNLEKFFDNIDYPEDIAKLRNEIPVLCHYTNNEIQQLYRWWSENYFCADWMVVGTGSIREFESWLNAESEF